MNSSNSTANIQSNNATIPISLTSKPLKGNLPMDFKRSAIGQELGLKFASVGKDENMLKTNSDNRKIVPGQISDRSDLKNYRMEITPQRDSPERIEIESPRKLSVFIRNQKLVLNIPAANLSDSDYVSVSQGGKILQKLYLGRFSRNVKPEETMLINGSNVTYWVKNSDVTQEFINFTRNMFRRIMKIEFDGEYASYLDKNTCDDIKLIIELFAKVFFENISPVNSSYDINDFKKQENENVIFWFLNITRLLCLESVINVHKLSSKEVLMMFAKGIEYWTKKQNSEEVYNFLETSTANYHKMRREFGIWVLINESDLSELAEMPMNEKRVVPFCIKSPIHYISQLNQLSEPYDPKKVEDATENLNQVLNGRDIKHIEMSFEDNLGLLESILKKFLLPVIPNNLMALSNSFYQDDPESYTYELFKNLPYVNKATIGSIISLILYLPIDYREYLKDMFNDCLCSKLTSSLKIFQTLFTMAQNNKLPVINPLEIPLSKQLHLHKNQKNLHKDFYQQLFEAIFKIRSNVENNQDYNSETYEVIKKDLTIVASYNYLYNESCPFSLNINLPYLLQLLSEAIQNNPKIKQKIFQNDYERLDDYEKFFLANVWNLISDKYIWSQKISVE